MHPFVKRFLALWTAFILPWMSLAPVRQAGSAYAPQNADKVQICAAVVSDLHTNNMLTHTHNFKLMRLFSGMSKSEAPLDAVLIPGDLTERAQVKEYLFLSEALRSYFPTENILAAIGNHDARGIMAVEDHAQNMQNYYDFCASLGIQTDKPYWSQIVNGYTIILLGSEDEVKDCAYISPAQLRWLDKTLVSAAKSRKPAIILCHQTFPHVNNVDESWPDAGTIGEQSNAVMAVLRKRANAGLPILFISGHLHDEFSAHSFESPSRNIYCLNLPSAQYNTGGRGVVLEAYADRILLRTRDFISGEWLPDVYTVPCKGK